MPPSRRERVRYIKPAGIVIGAMVHAHARALAYVSFGSSTGWSAFLFSAIGLQNVDFTPSLQSPINEVVEPGGRELPALQVFVPRRVRSPVVTYPRAIALFERYAEEDWRRSLSPDHRNAFLIPDRFYVGQFSPPRLAAFCSVTQFTTQRFNNGICRTWDGCFADAWMVPSGGGDMTGLACGTRSTRSAPEAAAGGLRLRPAG